MATVGRTKRTRSQITVVEQVYYQVKDEQPRSVVSRYTVVDDSPDLGLYGMLELSIELVQGTEWRRIDLGDFTDRRVSLLLIANVELPAFNRIPTKKQLDYANSLIAELLFSQEDSPVVDLVPHGFIPPGESLRMRPGPLENLRIRSPNGPVKLIVTLFA